VRQAYADLKLNEGDMAQARYMSDDADCRGLVTAVRIRNNDRARAHFWTLDDFVADASRSQSLPKS